MLLSMSRVNYISSLSVLAMDLHDDTCTFYPTKLLTFSSLGEKLTFRAYPPDRNLCVIAALQEYLTRRATLTQTERLLVTYQKPHKPAHRDTVARWLKNVLQWAGIDIKTFQAHSYRAASSSYAKAAQAPITDILQQG